MPRYGDLDRLAEVLERNFGHTGGAAVLKQLIDNAPTADVVEVVRCKDCEYWRNPQVSKYDGLVRGECYHAECGGVWENGYCSDGERRNDEV